MIQATAVISKEAREVLELLQADIQLTLTQLEGGLKRLILQGCLVFNFPPMIVTTGSCELLPSD
jgi:hypothetical protein